MIKMGKGVLGSNQKYSRIIPGSELRNHLWQFSGNHMQHRETNQGQLCVRKAHNPLHYLSGFTYLLIVKIGTCVIFQNGQVALTWTFKKQGYLHLEPTIHLLLEVYWSIFNSMSRVEMSKETVTLKKLLIFVYFSLYK